MPEYTYDPSVWEVVDGRVTRYLGDNPIVIVPKELSYICKDTFYLSNALFVCFPNGDTYLEEGAFRGSNVQIVDLPENLTRIENSLFSGASKLNALNIPDTVTYIGKHAFEGCYNLKHFLLPANLKMIDERAFAECGFVKLEIPDSVMLIEEEAFATCRKLQKVIFGKKLKSIGIAAFAECTRLTALEFKDDSVESLGAAAFYNDVLLKNVTLPNGLLHIGEFCFFKIKNMTVNAPRSLKVHIEQYYYEESRHVGFCCTVFPPDVSSIFESDAKINYFERTVASC